MMAVVIRWCLLAILVGASPMLRAEGPVVLVVGDSLSAAYGIPASKGWVALLQDRLAERGYPHQVVNASVSGETSAGGLARLPSLLRQHDPRLVLIELGGNDGLRGQPPARLQQNLQKMVDISRDAGARPMLFAMRIPPNYGRAYTEAFEGSFATVAADRGVPLVPFFLAPIAEQPDQFQADGIHPDVAAQPALLDAVWPHLEAELAPAASEARGTP
jgi:acyl-CoA thioesterase I